MSEQKSVTLNGLIPINFLYLCLSIGMIFVGAYLTSHFFDTMYPTGLKGASTLCNINDFWGCDKATQSDLGVIAGMPTSIFGIIMGVIGLFAAFAGSREVEKTTKTVLLINAVVCLALLVYSLVALGSLCPMCTGYYVLSLLAYFIFHKFSTVELGVDPKIGGVYLVLVLVPLIGMNFYISKKEAAKTSLASSYISNFNILKDYGDPIVESDYKVHMGTKNFADAPIRVSVFSDFQCPYCKAVSDQLPKLIERYKDKINIQYMFYPLDPSCNSKMKSGGHRHACQAAFLSACDTEKFAKVHDHIFEHQTGINTESIKEWGKLFDLPETCFTDKNIQDKIQQTLNAGEQYKVQSTPTVIINGKKLEGMVPTVHLISILDSLLKE